MKNVTSKVLMVVLLLAVIFLPQILGNKYYIHIAVRMAIWAIAVLGLGILVGLTGQVSVAQASFLGIGSYASSLLALKAGMPFWLCLPLAGIIAAVIGVLIGFTLQLVMSAVITGGQAIALQMGLGFSLMVDPQHGAQVPVLSQFYILLVILIYLALNGHLVLIEVMVDSFTILPIGQSLMPESMWQLVQWGSHIFAGAVAIALPAIASLLIINIAFGIMTRAVPQLNIFAIGFPITMTLGFGIVLFTLPSVVPHATGMFNSAYQLIKYLLGGSL